MQRCLPHEMFLQNSFRYSKPNPLYISCVFLINMKFSIKNHLNGYSIIFNRQPQMCSQIWNNIEEEISTNGNALERHPMIHITQQQTSAGKISFTLITHRTLLVRFYTSATPFKTNCENKLSIYCVRIVTYLLDSFGVSLVNTPKNNELPNLCHSNI